MAEDDNERTLNIPNPGGRGPLAAALQAAEDADEALALTGVNPLAEAAAPLVALAVRLRGLLACPDVNALHARALAEVRGFAERAQAMGIDQKVVGAARYALCATIDDLVLTTPWGAASLWTGSGMVINFHREAMGGERFFALLDGVRKDPARNLHLLELLYICLSVGFQGRYRVEARGPADLARMREEVWQTIRNQRGEPERGLSPQWQGIGTGYRPLSSYIPAWVSGLAALAVVLLCFFGYSLALNLRSDDTLAQLAATPPTSVTLVRQAKALPPPKTAERAPRLREFLAPEIRDGIVTVSEDATTVTVRIRNRGMFGSGSDQVAKTFLPVLDRIGAALEDEPGSFLVAGHSDNQPIRSARFPSNWHLSKARAETVRGLLAKKLTQPGRISADGFSDSRPVAGNDTPEGREQNRRIEVIVTKADAAG